MADGLPSNRINGIAEDRSGYLWIATSDGLARYDGVDFHAWRVEQGLHDNFIWSVHADARNRIWFGTHQAGLAVFDAGRRQFRHYSRSNTPAMASDDVWSVTSTPDGSIWFGTADAGLYRLGTDGKTFTRFMPRPTSRAACRTPASASWSSRQTARCGSARRAVSRAGPDAISSGRPAMR